jgi:hypothetical protein
VAARGRNTKFPVENGYQILVFDVPTLLSDSPNNGFLGYGSSGGTAPVGMALFQNETLLAVANSNRFYANCEFIVAIQQNGVVSAGTPVKQHHVHLQLGDVVGVRQVP